MIEAGEEYGHSLWEALLHVTPTNFPQRSASALEGFRDLILSLQKAADELPLPELLGHLLETTSYAEIYQGKDADSEAKLENIQELLTAAQEFAEKAGERGDQDPLNGFLDHVSLVSDIDSWEPDRGVSLMTLHSAKGLEFNTVAVAGLENGLLPHINSQEGREDHEEERRLLYVGMTRAKARLFLSSARRRRIAGRYQTQEDSPFLIEIPQDLVEVSESPDLLYDDRTRGVYSYFGGRVPDSFNQEIDDHEGLRRGARVRHPSLGEGLLLDIEGEGENCKVTVYFESVGKRKLAARYANLQPV